MRIILVYHLKNVLHKSHVFTHEEASVVGILKYLMAKHCWDLLCLLLVVFEVYDLVMPGGEHSDGYVFYILNGYKRRLRIIVKEHVPLFVPVIKELKLFGVDELPEMNQTSHAGSCGEMR